MTTIPYNAVPGSPAQLTGPAPVQIAVGEVALQRRVTVLFRLLMAVPHFVVLYFLGVVAFIIAFIGWWAALFTGRLPEFAQTYLAGYQLWSTRVIAYLMLLTDVYPPFSLDDDPRYPLRLAIPAGERLNPAAVLFRFILVIPAVLLDAVASFGAMTIIGFIGWLITLFTGRLPASLHLAYTVVLRYQARVNCYLYLLTAAYPGGLFGDGPAVAAAPVTAGGPAEPDYVGPDYVGPGYTAPGYAAPGYDAPGYGAAGYGIPGYAAPGGYGVPQTEGQPADWRLLLTPGAKTLVGWFIGLGTVLFVAWIAVQAAVAGNAKPGSTAAVPAGYQRVGGSEQGISVAAPASWVQLNLAQETLENGIKKLGLRGAVTSTLIQDMQALQTAHPVVALDVQAAVSEPSHFAPNLNANCSASGVTDVGSAGVPFLKAVAAAEFQKLGADISQQKIDIGGVPGIETSYELNTTSMGTIYGSQLEVLAKPGRACFVTVSSGSAQLSANIASIAAQTAQFP